MFLIALKFYFSLFMLFCSKSVRGDEEAKRNSHRPGHRGRHAGQGEGTNHRLRFIFTLIASFLL